MKLFRVLLGIAILWGVMVATVLVALHYTRSYIEVDIHWRSAQTELLQATTIATALPDRETRHYNKLPAQTVSHGQCSDILCTEHLTKLESEYFVKCQQKTKANVAKFGELVDKEGCVFQNNSGRPPVALASFPGSGNTWVRGLLQKVTGYCTGALYCDGALRTGGFSGEGVRGPSVLVVKAHSKSALFSNQKLPRRILNDSPVYGAAILLVRNPRQALVAEWHRERTKRLTNRTVSNHYLSVGQEFFGNNTQWDKYVRERMARWKAHISGWILAGRLNPFLVISYEQLKHNTSTELLKMLEFLGFSEFTLDSVQEKLGLGYDSFYRNHKDEFEHFTESQETYVSSMVKETAGVLAQNGLDRTFPIGDYI